MLAVVFAVEVIAAMGLVLNSWKEGVFATDLAWVGGHVIVGMSWVIGGLEILAAMEIWGKEPHAVEIVTAATGAAAVTAK